MKLSNLKKYDKFLKSTNKKIVDVDTLSKGVNIKADLIIDDLIYFEPMLRMIVENYNFRNLEKNIEDYISNSIKKETKKKTKRLKYEKYLGSEKRDIYRLEAYGNNASV